jgi:hypothetical protein
MLPTRRRSYGFGFLEPHTGFVGDLGESPIAIWDTASGQAGPGGVLTVFTTGAVFSASEANAEPSPAVIDEALRQIEMTVSERARAVV